MARPSSKDPLDKFRWAVSIDGFTKLGFTSVETPKMSINTQSYPEGGSHMFPRQLVDSFSFKPIALTRGATTDKSFLEWATQSLEILGVGRRMTNPSVGTRQFAVPSEYRRNVQIDHMDRAGRVVRSYILHKAFPIEYEPASDFSADADDTYSMEKLVLAYESFEVVTTTADSNPFSIKDVTKRLLRRSF